MNSELINRQWTVAGRPNPKLEFSMFGYQEAPVPYPQDGQILLKTHYLNIAPVMRMYMMEKGVTTAADPLDIGDVIHGRGVAEVLASKHPDFAVGDFVHGQIGWQTYKLSSVSKAEKFIKMTPRGVPAYYGLSALGMTGYSAYCGFMSRGEPQAGEAVLVSGAAGGVGSLVVQIAKAIGCSRVIGIAGGSEKCAIVKSLGADETIDYKSENIDERLDELFPNGVDVYFDNVGGEILDTTILHLNYKARIVQCGAISEYTREVPFGLKNHSKLANKNADLRGFFVYNHGDEFSRAEVDMAEWIKQGQLKALVDISDGFEQMPHALMGLYTGRNIGKKLVRVIPGEDVIY